MNASLQKQKTKKIDSRVQMMKKRRKEKREDIKKEEESQTDDDGDGDDDDEPMTWSRWHLCSLLVLAIALIIASVASGERTPSLYESGALQSGSILDRVESTIESVIENEQEQDREQVKVTNNDDVMVMDGLEAAVDAVHRAAVVVEMDDKMSAVKVLLEQRRLIDAFEEMSKLLAWRLADDNGGGRRRHAGIALIRDELAQLAGGIGKIDVSVSQQLAVLESKVAAAAAASGNVDDGEGLAERAHRVVMKRGVLMIGTQLEGRLVRLSRALLTAMDSREVSKGLSRYCGVRRDEVMPLLSHTAIESAVRRRTLVPVAGQCVLAQRVVGRQLQMGGSLTEANAFDWTLTHHIAALGYVPLLDRLVELVRSADSSERAAAYIRDVLLAARTVTGMSALHVAAMRGHVDMARRLVSLGHALDARDMYERTPLDVAVAHRFAAQEMADALGPPLDAPIEFLAPLAKLADAVTARGFWADSVRDSTEQRLPLPPPLRPLRATAIDAIDGDRGDLLDVFVRDYLSIERPVLVRAAHMASVRRLQRRWIAESLLAHRAAVPVSRSAIPYASAFGRSMQRTTLGAHVAAMRANAELSLSQPVDTGYVFESLDANSLLRADADIVADALFGSAYDADAVVSVQFYLGPRGSGAPLHYHGSAWNLLVHGRKRWFLLPPQRAAYSTRPVLEWIERDYARLDPPPIEFIQEAGDIVFVPNYWAHAVLNLLPSVGVAFEFTWGSNEFSIM
jgi:ankyrin repeat protein